MTAEIFSIVGATSGGAILGIIGTFGSFAATKRVGISVFVGTMCFVFGSLTGFVV